MCTVTVPAVAARLDELIREKADERGWGIVILEVMPDQVHLFVTRVPKSSPSYVANQLKGYRSRVLRSEFPHLKSRLPTLWSFSSQQATLHRLNNAFDGFFRAEKAGRRVTPVDARNTSRTCPDCGHVDGGNRLTQASFTCQRWGDSANADVVGATNVAYSAGLVLRTAA